MQRRPIDVEFAGGFIPAKFWCIAVYRFLMALVCEPWLSCFTEALTKLISLVLERAVCRVRVCWWVYASQVLVYRFLMVLVYEPLFVRVYWSLFLWFSGANCQPSFEVASLGPGFLTRFYKIVCRF